MTLINEINQLDGQLWLDGGRLKYRFPSNVVSKTLLDKLRQHKQQITEYLQQKYKIPMGYSVLPNTEVEKLFWLKDQIIKAGICSLDYESNSDPDDKTQDPQDTEIVGASVSYQIGQAVYLPMKHIYYDHNWDKKWLIENFLKPVLEHPDVLIIAHNIAAEHAWSILEGIDMYPKAQKNKIMDTMMIAKNLALPETVKTTGKIDSENYGGVYEGLKDLTKILLADQNGMVHDLIHVNDIQSFKETVGKVPELIPHPEGGVYKTNSKFGKKGEPRMQRIWRYRRFDEMPIDKKTIDYACSDADWALGLYKKLIPMVKKEGLEDLVHFDIKRMMLLAEYQLAGWHTNPGKIEEFRKLAEHQLYGDEKHEGIESKLKKALLQIAKENNLPIQNGEVIVPAGKYFMGTIEGYKDGQWGEHNLVLEVKKSKPFSWSSPQAKQWLFYYVLEIPTDGLNRSPKTGLPSVDKDNMKKIFAMMHGKNLAFFDLLKEKMKYDKLLSTYVDGMGQHIRKDTNKIHTNLRVVSTWRLASKKPNLQNIPRPENDLLGIREVFVAPTYDPSKDYSHLNKWTRPPETIKKLGLSGEMMWIGCDYSQLELRIAAWYSQEPKMMEAFRNGYDLHSAAAKDVFKLDCDVSEVKEKYKSYRKKIKPVNFGLIYGITAHGLANNPDNGMTIEEAEELMRNYFSTYKNIKKFMRECVDFAKRHKYVTTMFGHRRPIPHIDHEKAWVRNKAENKAMNTPVQGSGADIMANAMIAFRDIYQEPQKIYEVPTIKDYKFNHDIIDVIRSLKAVMQIHDELIFEVPVEFASDGAKIVKAIMEQPIEGFTDVMPLIADPAVGKVWAHNLDIDWDEDGTAYVYAKREKKDPADVTIDEIHYALPLYEKAGIEVRVV